MNLKKQRKQEQKLWAFLTLLVFTQVSLKLFDVITWGWWGVTWPFWIVFVIFGVAIVAGLMVKSIKVLMR